MKYMGGKSRIAKEILPIVLKDRPKDQTFVEPFVGGCNITINVTGNRFAFDNNYYLIEMWKAVQNGWVPPDTLTFHEYTDIQWHKGHYEPKLVAFAGFACSYGGKWFGGYARGNTNKGEPRNYAAEGQRNILKKAPFLKDVRFFCQDYALIDSYSLQPYSLIYCDPPYAGTTQYGAGNKVNHEEFWDWCNYMVQQGHKVFVSEYTAPPDWECVWQKEQVSSLTKDTGAKIGIEKLFTKA